jgi:hypothetical protein
MFLGNLYPYDIMQTRKTNDFLVLHDVEVKEELASNSKTLIKLGICDEILELFATNFNNNKWSYIDTQRRSVEQKEYVKGWVLKSSIVRISEFKPVKKIREYYIQGGAGDYDFDVQLYSNGKYVLGHTDDNYQFIYEKGPLYSYSNIIIAGWEYLYIDKKGRLFSWIIDENGNHFQSKIKRGKLYYKNR